MHAHETTVLPDWFTDSRSVPVRAQGHVEQHEQANRHRVEDQASHAGLIGTGRCVVEPTQPSWLREASNARAPDHLAVLECVEAAGA
jgi:hypothetical protein